MHLLGHTTLPPRGTGFLYQAVFTPQSQSRGLTGNMTNVIMNRNMFFKLISYIVAMSQTLAIIHLVNRSCYVFPL